MVAPTSPDFATGSGLLVAIGVANILLMVTPVVMGLVAGLQAMPESWRRRASTILRRASTFAAQYGLGAGPEAGGKSDDDFDGDQTETGSSEIELGGVVLSADEYRDGRRVGAAEAGADAALDAVPLPATISPDERRRTAEADAVAASGGGGWDMSPLTGTAAAPTSEALAPRRDAATGCRRPSRGIPVVPRAAPALTSSSSSLDMALEASPMRALQSNPLFGGGVGSLLELAEQRSGGGWDMSALTSTAATGTGATAADDVDCARCGAIVFLPPPPPATQGAVAAPVLCGMCQLQAVDTT